MATDNSNGWIKLYRQLMDSEFYFSEPFTKVQAWIDLLLLASFKECSVIVNGTRVKLERGQLCVSQKVLASRWKWSRGKVIRYLDDLEKEQMVVQLKNNRTSIISITNYGMYQHSDTTDDTTRSTTNGTTDDTTDNTTLYDKEIKEEKENKNNNSLPPAASACEYIKSRFEENRELVWLSECWNEKTKGVFREISELTDANVKRWAYAKLYVDSFGKEKIVEAIARLPNAKFLIGKTFVDFDWIFGEDRSRFIKLLEGNYDEIYKPSKNEQENDRENTERDRLKVARAEEFYKPVQL